MKDALSAALRLGGGSVAAVVAAACLAKLEAVILGPSGMGSLALLLALVNVGAIPAALGVTQALVRRNGSNPADVRTTRRAAVILRSVGGGLVILPLVAFSGVIADSVFAGKVSRLEVDLAVLALGLNLVFIHDTGLLTARHRVGRFVAVTIADAFGAAIGTGVVIVVFGRSGLAAGLVVGAAIGVAVSRLAVRGLDSTPAPPSGDLLREVTALARDGLPYTAAMVFGTAAALAVPAIAVHLVDADGVAYYQASVTVSTAYLGFVVAVMGQDYLPRLAVAPRDEVGRMIGVQVRLLVAVTVPVVLATYALTPVILRVAFSSAFVPAGGILRWQLVADIMRFLAWGLSFAILARLRMRHFLLVELVGGAAIVGTTIACSAMWGLAGLGIAWVVTYGLYLAVCAGVGARSFGARVGPSMMRLLAACAVTVVVLIAVTATGRDVVETLAAVALGLVWSVHGVRVVMPELLPRRRVATDIAVGTAAAS